jgi:hypothetical protein
VQLSDCLLLPHAEIKTRDDVLAMGIDKYNEECRSIVMRWAAATLVAVHV